MEKGDEREVDTSCDLAFMRKVMPEVGKKIREKYAAIGVSIDVPIFLFWTMREGMEPTRWSTNTCECWRRIGM